MDPAETKGWIIIYLNFAKKRTMPTVHALTLIITVAILTRAKGHDKRLQNQSTLPRLYQNR